MHEGETLETTTQVRVSQSRVPIVAKRPITYWHLSQLIGTNNYLQMQANPPECGKRENG